MLNRIAIGFVLTTAGATAIALASLYRQGGALRLLSFGLFSLAYGLRILMTAPPLVPLWGLPPRSLSFIASFMNYLLPPLVLIYTEQIQGAGWMSSIRRLWQLAFVLAAIFIGFDVWTGRPGAAGVYYRPFVLLVIVILLPHVMFWRHHDRVEYTGRLIGTGLLLVASVHDTLMSFGLMPWRFPVEVYGVGVFILSLGFVTARRAFEDQRQLAAVERELDTARAIQTAILPQTSPAVAGLDIEVRYLPTRSVAGDVYDFVRIDEHRIAVLVADVTGHGVPAALIASMVKVAFSSEAAHAADPGTTLASMNRVLYGHFEARFVTAVCVFVDVRRGVLAYSLAGHPPPLFHGKQLSRLEKLTEGGLMLGLFSDTQYPTTDVPFEPGDRLVLYTDALIEAANSDGEWFGDAELESFVSASASLTAPQLADALVARLHYWSAHDGRPFDDDLTIAVIDRLQ